MSETGKVEWKYQIRYILTVFLTKSEGAFTAYHDNNFFLLAQLPPFNFFIYFIVIDIHAWI